MLFMKWTVAGLLTAITAKANEISEIEPSFTKMDLDHECVEAVIVVQTSTTWAATSSPDCHETAEATSSIQSSVASEVPKMEQISQIPSSAAFSSHSFDIEAAHVTSGTASAKQVDISKVPYAPISIESKITEQKVKSSNAGWTSLETLFWSSTIVSSGSVLRTSTSWATTSFPGCNKTTGAPASIQSSVASQVQKIEQVSQTPSTAASSSHSVDIKAPHVASRTESLKITKSSAITRSSGITKSSGRTLTKSSGVPKSSGKSVSRSTGVAKTSGKALSRSTGITKSSGILKSMSRSSGITKSAGKTVSKSFGNPKTITKSTGIAKSSEKISKSSEDEKSHTKPAEVTKISQASSEKASNKTSESIAKSTNMTKSATVSEKNASKVPEVTQSSAPSKSMAKTFETNAVNLTSTEVTKKNGELAPSNKVASAKEDSGNAVANDTARSSKAANEGNNNHAANSSSGIQSAVQAAEPSGKKAIVQYKDI